MLQKILILTSAFAFCSCETVRYQGGHPTPEDGFRPTACSATVVQPNLAFGTAVGLGAVAVASGPITGPLGIAFALGSLGAMCYSVKLYSNVDVCEQRRQLLAEADRHRMIQALASVSRHQGSTNVDASLAYSPQVKAPDLSSYVLPATEKAKVEAEANWPIFNAFDVWRDGVGTPFVDYPAGYFSTAGEISPEGVFYVDGGEYWSGSKFLGIPTFGAVVEGNTLVYPSKNGKQLKLKFFDLSSKEMSHKDAAEYCRSQGVRLPTARELLDFCGAGVTEPNYGPSFREDKYPRTARCGRQNLWSASVGSNYRGSAWRFYGAHGTVNASFRKNTYGVRCVGAP
jgi:hypothetical protein